MQRSRPSGVRKAAGRKHELLRRSENHCGGTMPETKCRRDSVTFRADCSTACQMRGNAPERRPHSEF